MYRSLFEPCVRPKQLSGERNSVRHHLLDEFGSDAGCLELTRDLAFSTQASLTETENFLHGDDLAFHAGEFRQAQQFAATIRQTADLDDDVPFVSCDPAL